MRRPAQPAPEIPGLIGAPDVIPAHTIGATVASTLLADGDGFETRPVASLTVDFDGVAGDRHRGATRFAGAREPWFPRGVVMRNERQVTIVASDELADIAAALALPEIRPEWLGANLVLRNAPRLSWIPAGARIFFDGGAVLAIEGQNAPCLAAGAAIGRHHPERTDIALSFPKVARRLRGLIGSVEVPGVIVAGSAATVRVREQWIYR
ncbi:MAG: molybdenum cofactor sulfurase [Beijerinckiaceae bacterium]